MRKILAIVLCVLLMLFLYACQSEQSQTETNAPTESTTPAPDYSNKVFTFPEGTVLYGFDLSGQLGNYAYTVLENAVSEYTLDLTLNGQLIELTAKEMGMAFSETEMQAYIDAIKAGQDPSVYEPVTYNAKQLASRIAVCANALPKNVSLAYNPETNAFEFVDPIPGTVYDLDPVIQELDSVIRNFGMNHTAIAVGSDYEAPVTAEDPRAIQAQEKANTMLRTALTYSFTPDDSPTTYVALTIDDIGGLITFDSDLNAKVDPKAVTALAEMLEQEYSVGLNDGYFLTSMGEYIALDIEYADQLVDAVALAEDITYCLENGISGHRTATYLPKEKGWSYDLDGNYVEVNLTEQRLWAYNNYECVMSTPVVTGCVANDWLTVTGAFDISYKEINTQLMGLDVTWWMPFHGNFGLHDARWRTNFANTEYLFNGSHGCINIPPWNTRAVFVNVDWDTPVIVYGGVNENNPIEQEITGTTEYHLGINTTPFKLDATPKYGYKSRLTYTCDNTEVVTVSDKGEIRVVGVGTAHITVESPDWDFCPTDSMVVTITVHDSCSETGHLFTNWTLTSSPTCSSTGTEVSNCAVCGVSETRNVPVHHYYDDWDVTKEPTCYAEGQQERICVVCAHIDTASVEPLSHIYCRWTVVEKATATTEGVVEGVCFYCGNTTQQVLPVLPAPLKTEE